MARNKFGWSYPPGAANDPKAPYNQEPVEECEECGGRYTEDGHRTVGEPEQQRCAECEAYWEDEERERCPECGSDDLGGLPCPNSGMNMNDLEDAQESHHQEMRMEEQRLEERSH